MSDVKVALGALGVVVVGVVIYQVDAMARMIGVELGSIETTLEVKAAHARVALSRFSSGDGLPSAQFERASWTGNGAEERYRKKRGEAGPFGSRGNYLQGFVASLGAVFGYGAELAGDRVGFVHPSGMTRGGYSPMTGDSVPDDYPSWAKVQPKRAGPVLLVGKARRQWPLPIGGA